MKALKLKKLIFISFISLALFGSCKNWLTSSKPQITDSDKSSDSIAAIDAQNETAELSIQISNGKAARTVNPNNYNAERFVNFVLTGKLEGTTTEKQLFSAEGFDKIDGTSVALKCGTWELTLSAKYNGITFSDTKTIEIKRTQQNRVTFTLKPTEHFGGFEIKYDFNGGGEGVPPTAIRKVEAVLKKADGTGAETKYVRNETQIEAANNMAVFSRDITNSAERLESGSYLFTVKFYADPNDPTPINTREDILCIQDGLMSVAEIRINFNEIFTISYQTEDGTTITNLSGSGFAIKQYSARSHFDLPEIEVNGKLFIGWKSNGSNISEVNVGSTGNLTLVADLREPVLYVSGVGDDPTGDGWTYNTAFESIDKACEKIEVLGNSTLDWTIYICGDVTGPHSSDKKAGSRGTSPSSAGDTDFGRTVIPADITSDYAKSSLLIGKTGLDANGNPQDMLNRGLVQGSSTSYKDTGNVIAIATTVPVTIKNLKITGGNNSSPNSNSTNDPYYQNGGGLNVAAGANVTLDDGVLIIKNKAYNGGAVYNAGTLTMVGTATIGDSSATTYPQNGITSSTNPASNEYKYGGGIYNTGTLYLGIEGKDLTEGKELTGGIYNSYGYAAFGGGIYNSGNGSVVMSSGKINYNDGQSNGGGVYLNSGTFKMTGGEIFYNSTGDQGGGVYVNTAAVFYFGGGTISGNNANTYGGGVYIKGDSSGSGKMFMYGDAVIGKSSATSQAPEIIAGDTAGEKVAMETGCNMAVYGAGIYAQGELYIGYSDQDVTKPLTGGIFYNTAKKNVNYGYSNGGALFVTGSYANVIMNSGTINYNYAKEGPGIYITSNYFTMTSLTVGTETYVPIISQNIGYSEYYYSINIDSLLASAAAGAYHLVPPKNNAETGYSTNVQLIKLTAAAAAQNITIDNVKGKFTVEKFTNPKTGITSNWIIDSSGKLAQKVETINVSSSGTCTSISDAVAQMNDSTKDYIIALSGIITGPQTIPGTVLANSITIKGVANTSATSVPSDGINANLADGVAGTALTINTSVPVTLDNICVKGGHGTEKDGAIIGGGLLLGQNAHVCLDNNTRILQNITYNKGDGTPGYGAGVYISNKAKLYENKYCHITENTATCRGAGVYIASGGTLQTMAGSGSYITLNTFDTNFTDSSNNPVTRCGGAVYIEDGATYEMFGAWLWVNCLDINNCLGSGIYLSTTGKLRVSGHTEVVVPNDIYLKNGASIEIAAALDPNNPSNTGGPVITARLLPETYSEGVLLVKPADGLSDYTFTNAVKRLEVLPSEVSGQTQYWAIDNTGQLVKKTGTELTVTVPTDINDISISVTSDGTTIAPGSHFTGGSTLKFTAPAGYEEYRWTVDGEEESHTNELTVNASALRKGNYVVYLEAKGTDGKYYSYTAQIKVDDF